MELIEVPEDILSVLKCSKCELFLSRGRVYLCADGGGLCDACYKADPSVSATRNTHYEAVGKLLLFPCKNQDEGCTEKVPFTDPAVHEEVCKHRQYVCPLVGSSGCDWSGPSARILEHCKEQHPDRVLDSPTTLTHDITKSSTDTYLLQAFHLLFLLFAKVCVTSGKIYYSVRYLGGSSDVQNFRYMVNITREDETVTKKGQVVPQGYLAIQEDSSLIININSLLSILGGFNDTTFTVTMEQLFVGEKCCKCRMLLPIKEYRDSEGWKCVYCAPSKTNMCNSQSYTRRNGCTYKTYPKKIEKHYYYFCDYEFQCKFCLKSVKNSLLHYDQFHTKYANGSAWRVGEKIEQRVLVSSDAGTTVCYYNWKKSYFELSVYIPVENDQLSNFLCKVKVTLVATGQTRTFTPDITYNTEYDWCVKVTNSDFNEWCDRFDISVSVNKII